MTRRVPLQDAVRATRARLARAEQAADLALIQRCVHALRRHAIRAAAEALNGGFEDTAGPLIRDLVGHVIGRWGLGGGDPINQFRERAAGAGDDGKG